MEQELEMEEEGERNTTDISNQDNPRSLLSIYAFKQMQAMTRVPSSGKGCKSSQTLRLTKKISSVQKSGMEQTQESLLKKRCRGMVGRRPAGTRSGHQQSKVFRCPLPSCGKIFYDRASLKKHNTVHGDKLFQCTYPGCEKRFLDNAKLKRHMLVHTGEKNYICELCNKRFSLDFNLKTHMRIHTGEKPFICPYPNCSKRFNQKSNLHAHQLTHHLEGGETLAI